MVDINTLASKRLRKGKGASGAKPAKPGSKKVPVKKAAAASPAPVSDDDSIKVPKLSVSLFQRDMNCIEGIKTCLGGYGIRNVNDSEAIRVALRATKPSPELLEIFNKMRDDDGRRRRRRMG